jgi:hypothetical protein
LIFQLYERKFFQATVALFLEIAITMCTRYSFDSFLSILPSKNHSISCRILIKFLQHSIKKLEQNLFQFTGLRDCIQLPPLQFGSQINTLSFSVSLLVDSDSGERQLFSITSKNYGYTFSVLKGICILRILHVSDHVLPIVYPIHRFFTLQIVLKLFEGIVISIDDHVAAHFFLLHPPTEPEIFQCTLFAVDPHSEINCPIQVRSFTLETGFSSVNLLDRQVIPETAHLFLSKSNRFVHDVLLATPNSTLISDATHSVLQFSATVIPLCPSFLRWCEITHFIDFCFTYLRWIDFEPGLLQLIIEVTFIAARRSSAICTYVIEHNSFAVIARALRRVSAVQLTPALWDFICESAQRVTPALQSYIGRYLLFDFTIWRRAPIGVLITLLERCHSFFPSTAFSIQTGANIPQFLCLFEVFVGTPDAMIALLSRPNVSDVFTKRTVLSDIPSAFRLEMTRVRGLICEILRILISFSFTRTDSLFFVQTIKRVDHHLRRLELLHLAHDAVGFGLDFDQDWFTLFLIPNQAVLLAVLEIFTLCHPTPSIQTIEVIQLLFLHDHGRLPPSAADAVLIACLRFAFACPLLDITKPCNLSVVSAGHLHFALSLSLLC